MKALPFRSILIVLTLAVAGWIVVQTRERWSKFFTGQPAEAAVQSKTPAPITEPKVLKLTEQARKNLGLVSRPARPKRIGELFRYRA
jgi:membrane fusion protein, heavy metal efflux system